jgi:transmembrane sensor
VAFGATKREVILEGEAFFQVVKNPEKPFLVYTGDVTTQVLGTSFTVKAFRAQNIQVSVKTGKVSVFTANPKNKEKKIQSTDTLVVLTPNQRVIYSLEGKQFMKTLVENPQVIDQKTANLKLVFRNQPLSQVFDRLEEVYGVDIVYDAQALALCTLTADLSESPSLNENLTIICKSMAGSYHVTDSRVVITSPGCN